LFKKTDFKTDSFSRLLTDVLFGVFGRLPDFLRIDLSTITREDTWGGGDVENVNYESRIEN
jgi:hypothetical protein